MKLSRFMAYRGVLAVTLALNSPLCEQAHAEEIHCALMGTPPMNCADLVQRAVRNRWAAGHPKNIGDATKYPDIFWSLNHSIALATFDLEAAKAVCRPHQLAKELKRAYLSLPQPEPEK